MKRGQANKRSDPGPGELSDDDLLLLAVALVKASGDDDQRFVAQVAMVFEALKELKPSARSRRRPTDA
jgi:hypothetical protein